MINKPIIPLTCNNCKDTTQVVVPWDVSESQDALTLTAEDVVMFVEDESWCFLPGEAQAIETLDQLVKAPVFCSSACAYRYKNRQ